MKPNAQVFWTFFLVMFEFISHWTTDFLGSPEHNKRDTLSNIRYWPGSIFIPSNFPTETKNLWFPFGEFAHIPSNKHTHTQPHNQALKPCGFAVLLRKCSQRQWRSVWKVSYLSDIYR